VIIMTSTILVTERAARRIAEIATADKVPALLRVAVDGGGCSGFQYRFELAAGAEADDIVIAQGAAAVVVDTTSAPFLAGSELDYVDDLIGASFKVAAPAFRCDALSQALQLVIPAHISGGYSSVVGGRKAVVPDQ
jgi:iron-sulfur cluster assembly accessory protein